MIVVELVRESAPIGLHCDRGMDMDELDTHGQEDVDSSQEPWRSR